jgi:hypothetical protein
LYGSSQCCFYTDEVFVSGKVGMNSDIGNQVSSPFSVISPVKL